MEESAFLNQAWNVFKIIAPWLTGGLAGAIITLIARRKEESRKRKVLSIESDITKYALPDINNKSIFRPEDLKISYKGQHYAHLSLYDCRINNIGPSGIEKQQLVFAMPTDADILEKDIVCSPIEIAFTENLKDTSDGKEYSVTFERLESGDKVSISVILDSKNVQSIKCHPRGVDDVIYQYGQIGQPAELESDIYKLLLFIGLLLLGNGVPFFGGALQSMIFILMIPYLRRIITFFIESRKPKSGEINIGYVDAGESGKVFIQSR